MARGRIAFWLCSIAVNLFGVPDLIRATLYPSAVLYAAYAVLVTYGLVVWRRVGIEESLADPAYETLGV